MYKKITVMIFILLHKGNGWCDQSMKTFNSTQMVKLFYTAINESILQQIISCTYRGIENDKECRERYRKLNINVPPFELNNPNIFIFTWVFSLN